MRDRVGAGVARACSCLPGRCEDIAVGRRRVWQAEAGWDVPSLHCSKIARPAKVTPALRP